MTAFDTGPRGQSADTDFKAKVRETAKLLGLPELRDLGQGVIGCEVTLTEKTARELAKDFKFDRYGMMEERFLSSLFRVYYASHIPNLPTAHEVAVSGEFEPELLDRLYKKHTPNKDPDFAHKQKLAISDLIHRPRRRPSADSINIIMDQEGNITDGHIYLRAMVSAGMFNIPCRVGFREPRETAW